MSAMEQNTPVINDKSTETNEELPKDQKPVRRTRFQIGLDNGEVYAHSLAFPPNWGDSPTHYLSVNITNYWKAHPFDYTLEYVSFGEKVLLDILDTKKAVLFPEGLIYQELSNKVPEYKNVFIFDYCQTPLNFLELCLASRTISSTLYDAPDGLSIKHYIAITNYVKILTSYDRPYMIKAVEKFLGVPLTHLAATANVQNTKYILGQLKLSNAIPLLHQLFSGPTLSMKLNAVVRLLELYEVLWADVQWCSVEKFAQMLLIVWEWLMEKTEMAKAWAEKGFNWIKSKLNPEEDKEPEVEKQTKLPPVVGTPPISEFMKTFQSKKHDAIPFPCSICNEASVIGCSLCSMHLCLACRNKYKKKTCLCDKAGIFIHNAAICSCAVNNDCLWTAVATDLTISVASVKRHVWLWLRSPVAEEMYNSFVVAYDMKSWFPEFAAFRTEVAHELERPNMCTTDSIIAICLAYGFGIRLQEYNNLAEKIPIGELKGIEFVLPRRIISLNYYDQLHFETSLEEFDGPVGQYIWGKPFIAWPHGQNSIPKPRLDKYINFHKKIAEKLDDAIRNVDSQCPEYEIQQIISSAEEVQNTLNAKVNVTQIVDSFSEVSDTSYQSDQSEVSIATTCLSDMVSEARSFVGAHHDSSAPSEPVSDDERDNLINTILETENKDSFFYLLKNCQWNAVGVKIREWFKQCSIDVLKFFEENKIVTGLISLFVGIGSFLGISCVKFGGSIGQNTWLRKFTECTRDMYYTERGLSSIKQQISTTIDAAKEILGISSHPEVDAFKVDVAAALDKARKMYDVAMNRPGQFVNDGSKFLEFKKDMEGITKVYTRLALMKDQTYLHTIQPIWYALNQTFDSLFRVYTKVTNSAMTRQEPVLIYLYGPTGLGKSHMTSELIKQLNVRTGRDMQVFTISKDPQFWNGYAQQDIIRIDDMNAVIGADGDTDSVVVFNLCTSAPYNPNMAHLDEKNLMMNAKFLIVCSNHPTIPTNSIVQHRQAWERRRNIFVNVQWPEHERCPKSYQNCEHWKKVLNKPDSKYSHLQFKLCDPEVTKVSKRPVVTDKGARRPFYDIEKSSELAEMVLVSENGVQITFDDIVQLALTQEQKFRADFIKRMEESPFASVMPQAKSWVDKPYVAVLGPPGTGKSHILQRFRERVSAHPILEIKTLKEFDTFVESYKTNAKYVLINDLSVICQSDKFKDFVNHCCVGYDENVKPSYLLIMAGNQRVLEGKMIDLFGNPEQYDVFTRRCNVIESKWKNKPFSAVRRMVKSKKFPVTYGLADGFSGEEIARHVQYKVGDVLMTQESVVTYLTSYEPLVVEVKLNNHLAERAEIDFTAALHIKMSSHEFCEKVNHCSLSDIFKIIRGGKAKLYSKTLTVDSLVGKLFNTFKKARDMEHTRILSLEDLLLQCWNKGYLSAFDGQCILFYLSDKMYYIDARGGIECGVLTSEFDLAEKAVKDLEMVEEIVSASTLFSGNRTILPHWLLLGGEIFSTIFSTATTAISSVFSVMDQKKLFDAYKYKMDLEDAVATGTDAAYHGMTRCVAETLAKINPYAPTKLIPGPSSMKARQYSDQENDPMYQNSEQYPDNDNGRNNRKSKIRNNRRFKESSSPVKMQINSHDEIEEEYIHDMSTDARLKNQPEKEILQLQCAPNDEVAANVVAQISRDPETKAIVDKILKNCVEILSIDGTRLCSGLVVKNNIVRTVLHLTHTLEVRDLRVRTMSGTIHRVEEVFRDGVLDRLDLRVVDPSFQPRPDILNHFPKLGVNVTMGSYGLLMTPSLNVLNGVVLLKMRSYMIKSCTIRRWPNSYSGPVEAYEYSGHRVGYLMAGAQTDQGDCGSLLILCDMAATHGKVLGMHICATSENAYASPLRYEQYVNKIQFQCASRTVVESEYIQPYKDPDTPSLLGFTKCRVYLPSKTRLYRNHFPIGPEEYEPSVLSSRDPRGPEMDVLFEESAKWTVRPPEFSVELKGQLMKISTDFANYVADKMERRGVCLRVLTSTESMNKLREVSKSEPINLHTSAGFPWNKMSTKPGKLGYVDMTDGGTRRFTKDPASFQNLQKLQSEIEKLENPKKNSQVIFQVFLKDELLKKKKIYTDAKKTRTIAAAPLHFTIVHRKFFHSAIANMMDMFDQLFFAVGINPHSLEWHALIMRLMATSTHGVDIDFKDWDFSQNWFWFMCVVNFYQILYSRLDPDCTDRDNEVRLKLYEKITFCEILIASELHVMNVGLPSGYPGTSIDGSIINSIALIWVWCNIWEAINPHIANLYGMLEDVDWVKYSDDSLVAISPYAAQHFNGITITEGYAKLGFKAQPTEKDGRPIMIKPLEECSFLSRGFKRWESFWIGPLHKPNMQKPTHFCQDRRSHHFWESPDDKVQDMQTVLDVYDSVLYEAALHGKDGFEVYRQAYNKVAAILDTLPAPSWEEIMARMFPVPQPIKFVSGLKCFECPELLELNWQHPLPKFFTKMFNRTSYHFGPTYTYKGSSPANKHVPQSLQILEQVNLKLEKKFNSVLVNIYPPGGKIPWHKDNEPELDFDEGVFGVTLKGDGILRFRNALETKSYYMSPGIGYLMSKECLETYYHMRDTHTMLTVTFTFRRLVPPLN